MPRPRGRRWGRLAAAPALRSAGGLSRASRSSRRSSSSAPATAAPRCPRGCRRGALRRSSSLFDGATPASHPEQARDPAPAFPTWGSLAAGHGGADATFRALGRDFLVVAVLAASAVVAWAPPTRPAGSRPRALLGALSLSWSCRGTSPGACPSRPGHSPRWCRWPPWAACGSASAASPSCADHPRVRLTSRPAIHGPGQPPYEGGWSGDPAALRPVSACPTR